jgi:dihydrofolate reductase
MSKVIFDISMSLDGFITAANRTREEPLGEGGEELLHGWAFGEDPVNREYLESAVRAAGAVIAGRRTYDDSVRWWNADGPTGPMRRPVFVVTHQPPDTSPPGGVYTFVTDGIGAALEQAKAVAGNQDVSVMGGASIGQQYLAAGLVDEISLHLVPVLFGAGTRMFERMGERHVRLEPISVLNTPAAIHARYRIVR